MLHWAIFRYFLSLGNVAISLVLAVLALGYCAVYERPMLLSLSKAAAQIRDKILTLMPWADGEIIARLVLHESTVLLMFFTIGARAVIGLLQLIGGFIFKRYEY
jgi:site-specific recombinase